MINGSAKTFAELVDDPEAAPLSDVRIVRTKIPSLRFSLTGEQSMHAFRPRRYTNFGYANSY